MLFLYRCILGLVALVLWLPARVLAARGSVAWKERFAWDSPQPCDVWLHGASVGEVHLVATLARALLEERPQSRLFVSAMTESGRRTAEKLLPGVPVAFFPLDATGPMRRRLRRLKPRLVVMSEVEIWPNLLRSARRAGVPLVLVNGRLKQRSFRRFGRFGRTMRRLLGHYDRVYFRSTVDRERYLALGLPPERGILAGDLKFDAPMPTWDGARLSSVRRSLGASPDDFVLVLGSTRPDEEQQLAEPLMALRGNDRRVFIVVAPRHIERASEVGAILSAAGWKVRRYQGPEEGSPLEDDVQEPGIALVDRLGVLGELFAAADLAFVGGTLTNTGGHNVLEPVWNGTPVLFGPDTENVPDAADYVLLNNYGARVSTAEELVRSVADVIAGRMRFAIREPGQRADSALGLILRELLARLDR